MEELPVFQGFVTERFLGQGGEGSVYLVKDELNEPFVIKRRTCGTMHDANVALQEGLAMARLNHPNIVKVYDVFILPHPADKSAYYVCFVIEFCGEGDVIGLLEGDPSKLLPSKVVEVVFGLLQGLDVMHHEHIVHRDLKSENLFLKNGMAKLGDLGLATKYDRDGNSRNHLLRESVGSGLYMAPEVLHPKKTYDERCDVWSLGVVLLELLLVTPAAKLDVELGSLANEDENWEWSAYFDKEFAPKLFNLKLKLKTVEESDAQEGLISLLQFMMNKNPVDRQLPATLLKNKVFAPYNASEASEESASHETNVSFRSLQQGEIDEGAEILSAGYLYDPRTYFVLANLQDQKRIRETNHLMYRGIIRTMWKTRPGSVWGGYVDNLLVTVFIVFNADHKKEIDAKTALGMVKEMAKMGKNAKGVVLRSMHALSKTGKFLKRAKKEGHMVDQSMDIAFLAVREDMRGKGIANAAMRFVMDWADSSKCTLTSVAAHPRAAVFLQAFDFERVMEENDEGVHVVLMKRKKK